MYRIILFLIVSLILSGCAANHVSRDILKVKQDNLVFAKQAKFSYQIYSNYQKKLRQDFLTHYYSPWENPYLYHSENAIRNAEIDLIKQFKKHPGYNENTYLYPDAWMTVIANNMDLPHFPNFKIKAITIVPTDLRMLPSESPSFTHWHKAGQGYPFDNLQVSRLNPNVPVYVIHMTQDHLWYLVITSEKSFGWVAAHHVAFANDDFVRQWKSQHYVTPVVENIAVKNKSQQTYFATRIGMIYPVIQVVGNTYEVRVAARDNNQNAIIKTAVINNDKAVLWPLLANTQNIANLANRFLGIPYGWGGLYGYRDCSATLKDLFAPFGIWLPRNSLDQARSKWPVSLKNLTILQKKQMMLNHAIPFFTLLWKPGHIMLYVGTDQNKPVIFHSPWGLRTRNYLTREEGRAVIGRTVITYADVGQQYVDSKNFLENMGDMIYIVPPQFLITQ